MLLYSKRLQQIKHPATLFPLCFPFFFLFFLAQVRITTKILFVVLLSCMYFWVEMMMAFRLKFTTKCQVHWKKRIMSLTNTRNSYKAFVTDSLFVSMCSSLHTHANHFSHLYCMCVYIFVIVVIVFVRLVWQISQRLLIFFFVILLRSWSGITSCEVN